MLVLLLCVPRWRCPVLLAASAPSFAAAAVSAAAVPASPQAAHQARLAPPAGGTRTPAAATGSLFAWPRPCRALRAALLAVLHAPLVLATTPACCSLLQSLLCCGLPCSGSVPRLVQTLAASASQALAAAASARRRWWTSWCFARARASWPACSAGLRWRPRCSAALCSTTLSATAARAAPRTPAARLLAAPVLVAAAQAPAPAPPAPLLSLRARQPAAPCSSP